MGQYYKFMNVDKKQVCQKNWHNIKLMEHSYLGNNYCDDILRLLSNEWRGDRVIHVGDYAEPNDETTTQNLVASIMKELNVGDNTLYHYADSFEEVKCKSKKDIRYVYNLDKKEYIDLFRQPIQWCYHDDKYLGCVKINSFALLIGCGNGLGGGDYHGLNEHLVGFWAGDKFISSPEPLKEYKDFKIRDEIYTEEKEYGEIATYNEEYILEHEKKVFNKELEEYRKYGHDINNLEFDSYGLLDSEQKVLESIFNINKDKKKDNEEDICI